MLQLARGSIGVGRDRIAVCIVGKDRTVDENVRSGERLSLDLFAPIVIARDYTFLEDSIREDFIRDEMTLFSGVPALVVGDETALLYCTRSIIGSIFGPVPAPVEPVYADGRLLARLPAAILLHQV
jgi:hypothetical protein